MMAISKPSHFSDQFTLLLKIRDVQLTGKILGKGSDATVQEVNWVGTSCAAKQLHEILLEDHSPGGAKRFVDNFEKECMTWSKLIHPYIVQFLGVYFLSGSRVPMLILEKMDTSLRHYLENHTKEKFVLSDKIYVLRQVAQALSYLHSRSPPLVHHDLSPNNVLLNEVSLQAKVTDFGMTRAMDPSKMTRKSSVKGTQAFMSPEALHSPPKYDEKLDVFSYGNVIVTTVTHKWPNPGQPTKFEGKKLIAVSELERRQQYLVLFTPKENELFLPIVCACLQNDPTMRPNSIQLVTQMRQMEESYPRIRNDYEVIVQLKRDQNQLHQVLTTKVEALRQVDEEIKENQICIQSVDENIHKIRLEYNQQLQEIKEIEKEKEQHLTEIDHLHNVRDRYCRENHQLNQHLSVIRKEKEKLTQIFLPHKEIGKNPIRNWRNLKFEKVLKYSGPCWSVDTNSQLVALGISMHVKICNNKDQLLRTIGIDQLGDNLRGVTFHDNCNILVTDMDNSDIKMFTIQGLYIRTIVQGGSTAFQPRGIAVSPDGHIYVCDHANHCVCVFDVNGKFLFSFGSCGSCDECFNEPTDLCFASDGFLYISDASNCRISVYDTGIFIGKFTTVYYPACIAASDCGHLVVGSGWSHKVMIYTTGGDLVHEFGEYGVNEGQFNNPSGVSVDSDGRIYIVDSGNHRIQLFTS